MIISLLASVVAPSPATIPDTPINRYYMCAVKTAEKYIPTSEAADTLVSVAISACEKLLPLAAAEMAETNNAEYRRLGLTGGGLGERDRIKDGLRKSAREIALQQVLDLKLKAAGR